MAAKKRAKRERGAVGAVGARGARGAAGAKKKVEFRSRPIETWSPRPRSRILGKVAAGSAGVGVPKAGKPCATRTRPGTSELVFLPAAEAERAGTVPGATIRLCTGAKQPGYLVPVQSSAEATKVARDWKACMARARAKVKECLLKVAPKARFGAGARGALGDVDDADDGADGADAPDIEAVRLESTPIGMFEGKRPRRK